MCIHESYPVESIEEEGVDRRREVEMNPESSLNQKKEAEERN